MTRPSWHVPPDPHVQVWVAAAAGTGWRVRGVRRLAGGMATAVDRFDLVDATGSIESMVLRRWLRPGWQDEDPAFSPAYEAAVLAEVALTSLPVPRVVAVDADGAATGAPAILLTWLPGRLPTRREERMSSRISPIVGAMTEIHRLRSPNLRARCVPFEPWYALEAFRPPALARQPRLWERAVATVGSPPVAGPSAFLHHDLHPANTLWMRGRLTGIVDWGTAAWGPPAADLAHLRANLGIRHGIAVADRALRAYTEAAGEPPGDQPWWDLRMLLDFIDEPETLAADEVARIESYLAALLARA